METPLQISETVELSFEQEKVLQDLRKAADSAKRVKWFAKVVDKRGLDTAIGFLAPVAGDLAASVVAGIYLWGEAENAGLAKNLKWKIAKLQAIDVVIGLLPLFDIITDSLFKANSRMVQDFFDRVEALKGAAAELNCPTEKIEEMSVGDNTLIKESAIKFIEKVKTVVKQKKE